MKQTILPNEYPARFDEMPCLVGTALRWGFFGLLMWWLWPAAGHYGTQTILWLIGLAVAFAMVRKELWR
jgi:hypothetical protein